MEYGVKIPWPGWHITGELGEGGYGRVYEIERTQSDISERAALKVISIPKSKTEYNSVRFSMDTEADTEAFFKEKRDRVLREIQALQSLKGCANVLDTDDWAIVDKEDGPGWDIFIRMELLQNLITAFKGGVATEEDVIELGKDICTALERCEKRNIVHRDIKPQNILVSQGKDYKLTDFGIARTLDHTTNMTGAGTPPYMSPEVYNGDEADKTVDTYSLGLVMYELLNDRRLPFVPKGFSPLDQRNAINRRMSGEKIPEPLSGSPELKQVVLKACSFDPKDRYASASEMKRAIIKAEKAINKDAGDEGSNESITVDPGQDLKPKTFQTGKRMASAKEKKEKTGIDAGWYDSSRTVGAENPGPKRKDKYEDLTKTSAANDTGKKKAPVNKDKKDPYRKYNTYVPKDAPAGQNKKSNKKPVSGNGGSKKKKIYLIAGICAVALLSAAAIIYSSYHVYSEATCTEPAKCKICGKVKGKAAGHDWVDPTCEEDGYCARCNKKGEAALGHDWVDPTCEEDGYCARCNKKGEAALGHDWIAATYDTPKTCSRCGKTEGNVKGYVSAVVGEFADKAISLNGWDTRPLVLNDPLENCSWISLGLEFTELNKGLYGKFRIYYRSGGKWEWYWVLDVSELNHEYKDKYNAEGDTVEAIAVVPDRGTDGTYRTYTYDIITSDAQVME